MIWFITKKQKIEDKTMIKFIKNYGLYTIYTFIGFIIFFVFAYVSVLAFY